MTTINNLLDKADHQYKQLQLNKSTLEGLLIRISDHSADRSDESSGSAPAAVSAAAAAVAGASGAAATAVINRGIQQLAQKYCGDCRASFEELGKIIQVCDCASNDALFQSCTELINLKFFMVKKTLISVFR